MVFLSNNKNLATMTPKNDLETQESLAENLGFKSSQIIDSQLESLNSDFLTPSILKESISTTAISKNSMVNTESSNSSLDYKPLGLATRKRIRKIKSCKFCYKRHIKCDKTQPICSVCRERGFSECTYYRDEEIANLEPLKKRKKNKQELTTSTVVSQIVQNLPNEKISDTKASPIEKIFGKIIQKVSVQTENIDVELRPNPILEKSAVTVKDGRILFFGPTCFRSSIGGLSKEESVLKRIFDAWNLFKEEKKIISQDPSYSLSNETKLLDYESSEHNILKDIVKVIPRTKQEIKYFISLYFRSPIHDILKMLDEDTVMSYIDEAFITDEGSDNIINITFTNKRNYYKAALILYLLGLTRFETIFPQCITVFFVFLQGQTTGKMMFIEKVQFLVIKCFFSLSNGYTGGDFSHLVNLVGIMCNTMVEFCLNAYECEKIYKNEVSLKYVGNVLGGNYKLLSRIFYVGLFVDAVCSCINGKQLFISELSYPSEWLLIKEIPDEFNDENDCISLEKMKMFLYHSRKLMSELYKPIGIPKISNLLENLFEYVHKSLNLNEMCYGDAIPETPGELNAEILQAFLASYALEIGIATLAVKSDCKIYSGADEEKNKILSVLATNQIFYYSLSIKQISSYLTKCISSSQHIFEKNNKSILLSNNLKTVGCDNLIFFLSFAPRFSSQIRVFSEFFKVLFCTNLLIPDFDNSYEYVEKLLEDEKTEGKFKNHLTKEANSTGLRRYVLETTLLDDVFVDKMKVEGSELYYLPKIYSKFHPELFQKGNLNDNLCKISFSGLQVYGWFTNINDEHAIIEDLTKNKATQFKFQLSHLKRKQKFVRSCFSTFLESLKEQKDKQILKKSKNLLRTALENKQQTIATSNVLNFDYKNSPNFQLIGNLSPHSNFMGTSNINPLTPTTGLNLLQKGIFLNSPGKSSRSNSNILENLGQCPMFNWDMNFVDFSSKMNLFAESPIAPPSVEDNEINILTKSIEKSNKAQQSDLTNALSEKSKQDNFMNFG
ncbi:hypothetical protein QEN19_003361 [Hanseniaspora menglaensis]